MGKTVIIICHSRATTKWLNRESTELIMDPRFSPSARPEMTGGVWAKQ